MTEWKRLSTDVTKKAYEDLNELVKKHGIKKKVLLSKIIEIFKENEDNFIHLLFGKKEVKKKGKR